MEGSITLYEMAKQMVATEKQMDMICLNKKLIELAKKMTGPCPTVSRPA